MPVQHSIQQYDISAHAMQFWTDSHDQCMRRSDVKVSVKYSTQQCKVECDVMRCVSDATFKVQSIYLSDETWNVRSLKNDSEASY